MTAVILFDQPVAGAGHAHPLPVIAWMIHVVREKLRTGFEKIDRVWAEVTNVLADTIPGIRVVKAFAQEKREATASAPPTSTTWRSTTAEQDLVAVLAHRHAAHRGRPVVVWAFGIWQISRTRSRSACSPPSSPTSGASTPGSTP